MASFSLVAFFRCRKIPRDMTLGLAHPKKLSVGDGNGLNRRWRDGLKSDREGSVPRRDRSDLTCASPLKQPRLARNSMLLTASFGSRIPLCLLSIIFPEIRPNKPTQCLFPSKEASSKYWGRLDDEQRLSADSIQHQAFTPSVFKATVSTQTQPILRL
jgi:hypothetical protein